MLSRPKISFAVSDSSVENILNLMEWLKSPWTIDVNDNIAYICREYKCLIDFVLFCVPFLFIKKVNLALDFASGSLKNDVTLTKQATQQT